MFGGITGDVLSMLTMDCSGKSDYPLNAGASNTQLEEEDEGNPVEEEVTPSTTDGCLQVQNDTIGEQALGLISAAKCVIEPTSSCGPKGRAHDLIRHHSGSSSRSIPRDGNQACSY